MLSQSDIDSMVSSMSPDTAPAKKPETKPEPPAAPPPAAAAEQPPASPEIAAQPAPGGGPTKYKMKQASMRRPEEVIDVGADEEAIATLTAQNTKLQEKVARLETKVQKLEQMEKIRSGVIAPVNPQQVQTLEKQVKQLTEVIQGISLNLQGTLGYDIYHSFTCEKCGAKEQVSSVYKCTHCGHESWLGWKARQ